jgi:hypothetical protein
MFFIAVNAHVSYGDLLDMDHDETVHWVKMTSDFIKSQNDAINKR